MLFPLQENNDLPKVLVTGGAGYIGSHTCKALTKAGFIPIAYDNLSKGHRYAVQWGPLEIGDVRDKETLDKVLHKHKPLAIMHFAAHALVSESIDHPTQYYSNNVAGTINLLETVRDHNIRFFIFSSSCTTYGNTDLLPIGEETAQSPTSPYGWSKLMAEQMLHDFAVAHDIHWAALRYFNAAGADLKGRIGEDHDPETHLIPLILQTALKEKEYLPIFGTDFETQDGSAVRDYVHVEDLADAHVKALRWLLAEKQNLVLNLGTGTGYSVLEIIKKAEQICKVPIPVKYLNRRIGDPTTLIADNAKAEKIIQWKPRFSDLETIIQSAWNWHQNLHKKRQLQEKEIASKRSG